MSVVSQIKHYQQSIEKCSNNESRLLHCIEKLYKLPVTVQHLQDTGVGRTVNALRKYEGTVGDASKALVAKWKTMVVDEESSDAEDDDDQNHPDVPEPYSDNSDLGMDKPPTPDKPDKTSERNSHRKHDSKHNHHHRSSDSRLRENSRSKSEKKSSKSSQDSSREKREKNDREKSKPAKEKERHSSKKEDTEESQKIHRSDIPKKEPKESVLHLSKENKQVNGSDQSRKRKHESPTPPAIPDKRANNSTDENSDAEEQILPQLSSTPSSVSSSMKCESPTPKSEANRKDSKREKHVEKSRSNHHKHRSDKFDEKSKSTRDHLASSSSSSRHKSSKDEKEQKSSVASSSKSKDQKSKSPSKKKIKKHLNEDEGIDCNSGATFAEALGMCSAPHVRKKSAPVSPSSPVMKSKAESNASTSKQKLIKTENVAKEDGLSLLGPNVKLEPLSVDLASTLPEISANYKPLPVNNYLNNTVHRKMEEDKVLNDAIYAKNMRTKVYSGNKSGYTSVPSLYDLCIRILIENIDALEATGGVPYDILKPVLERATPDQLFMLEHHNPYLIEDTDSLWQFHCNREFRNKQREEMESSREMYMRCLDEREAKLKTLTANIKQSIDKSVPVRSAKLAFVDNFVKPPRNVLRKQAKYGTARSSTSTSDLRKKIITGGHAATNIAVPPPPVSRVRTSSSGIVKKNKAPLMAKALQLIKGRYKR
ncbi:transcription elongation factor B polypeptide 3 [Diachasma alloeum]|uniref:transcription elongation factor B polypeptide 3 n=1 Tax=Diachasma alloeum TaxID=454923 RepID=UPI00073818DD|nr:transcription elongation factor B polypeptide 3 [Diachasma alloeum]